MRNPTLELVSFDVDGTMLRGRILDHARLPRAVHEKIVALDELFDQGQLGYEESLRIEYKLFIGMKVDEIAPDPRRLPLVNDLDATVQGFNDTGVRVVILTDNPSFAVEPLKTRGFQDVIASQIEAPNGVLTDQIEPLTDKLLGLRDYCERERIDLKRCAHVGDWINDVVVFRAVGLSVAFNPSEEEVSKAATYTVESDCLLDVYHVLRAHLPDQ
jgi:phosphoserine phosphatase